MLIIPEKKGKIPKESLNELYDKLLSDDILIGIIPNLSKEEFFKVFEDYTDFVDWESFSLLLRSFEWKKIDQEMLKKIIDSKYIEANRYMNSGNNPSAFQEIFDALRLESKGAKHDSEIEIVPSRIVRIAKGSGTHPMEVKQLVEDHKRF